MSGHSPIYIKIDLAKANNPPEKLSRKPRLNWGRSSPEQHEKYNQQLRDRLSQPGADLSCLDCKDVLCSNVSHLQDLDHQTHELLEAMTDSAWDNLEATKGTTGDQGSREHTIPGWNERVKPFQNEARFWYSLWVSAGKPEHSSIPSIEQSSFHFHQMQQKLF